MPNKDKPNGTVRRKKKEILNPEEEEQLKAFVALCESMYNNIVVDTPPNKDNSSVATTQTFMQKNSGAVPFSDSTTVSAEEEDDDTYHTAPSSPLDPPNVLENQIIEFNSLSNKLQELKDLTPQQTQNIHPQELIMKIKQTIKQLDDLRNNLVKLDVDTSTEYYEKGYKAVSVTTATSTNKSDSTEYTTYSENNKYLLQKSATSSSSQSLVIAKSRDKGKGRDQAIMPRQPAITHSEMPENSFTGQHKLFNNSSSQISICEATTTTTSVFIKEFVKLNIDSKDARVDKQPSNGETQSLKRPREQTEGEATPESNKLSGGESSSRARRPRHEKPIDLSKTICPYVIDGVSCRHTDCQYTHQVDAWREIQNKMREKRRIAREQEKVNHWQKKQNKLAQKAKKNIVKKLSKKQQKRLNKQRHAEAQKRNFEARQRKKAENKRMNVANAISKRIKSKVLCSAESSGGLCSNSQCQDIHFDDYSKMASSSTTVSDILRRNFKANPSSK